MSTTTLPFAAPTTDHAYATPEGRMQRALRIHKTLENFTGIKLTGMPHLTGGIIEEAMPAYDYLANKPTSLPIETRLLPLNLNVATGSTIVLAITPTYNRLVEVQPSVLREAYTKDGDNLLELVLAFIGK